MPIDLYTVPNEHPTYIQNNLFTAPTSRTLNDSVGFNIYQDLLFTRLNNKSAFGMTTGVDVALNHVSDFGFFCSYYFPTDQSFEVAVDPKIVESNPKFFSNMYFFCGTTASYIPWAAKIVHPKIGLDIGLGYTSATYHQKLKNETDTTYTFLILRPIVSMEVNIFSFLQWELGLGYRFQLSLINSDIANELLNGTVSTADKKMSGLEISTGLIFNIF